VNERNRTISQEESKQEAESKTQEAADKWNIFRKKALELEKKKEREQELPKIVDAVKKRALKRELKF